MKTIAHNTSQASARIRQIMQNEGVSEWQATQIMLDEPLQEYWESMRCRGTNDTIPDHWLSLGNHRPE